MQKIHTGLEISTFPIGEKLLSLSQMQTCTALSVMALRGGGGGGYESSSFRFGALLGRPDQLILLHNLERYEVIVAGNVRRVFTSHLECMKWSTKVSDFLDKEDADDRQAKLFI